MARMTTSPQKMTFIASPVVAALIISIFTPTPALADVAMPAAPTPAAPQPPVAAPPAPPAMPPPPPEPMAPPPPVAAPAPAAAPAAAGGFTKSVGGHIGVAMNFVTVGDKTQTISDRVGLDSPIGIGFHVSENLVVDFETIVGHNFKPSWDTGLVVDPGIVYNFGPVAGGLRVATAINAPVNIGLIPLINKGIVDLGGATWFVEAAFPAFVEHKKVNVSAVLHTGLGF